VAALYHAEISVRISVSLDDSGSPDRGEPAQGVCILPTQILN
jgi:hypothetical protein